MLGAVVASQIAAAPVYVKVVEATSDGGGIFLTSGVVASMKTGEPQAAIILGYLDCGWCENYRPYYNATLAASLGWTGPNATTAGILGPVASPEWPEEYEVQFWSSTWHTICNDWVAKLQ